METELLRKRARTRDVPIIFLTAISKDRKFISRGYDVGAVDYLFKPYEPDILRSKVGVFVELARKNEIIRRQHEALREMRRLMAAPAPEVPGLALLGSDEAIVNPGRVRRRLAGWAGARLVTLPAARHEVLMEAPAIRGRVLAEIAGFFAAHG